MAQEHTHRRQNIYEFGRFFGRVTFCYTKTTMATMMRKKYVKIMIIIIIIKLTLCALLIGDFVAV